MGGLDTIGGEGGLANREPASCAVHFTDCCGFSWRLQPNKRIPRARLSAAEARTEGGLGPLRLHLVCQAGTTDLRKPLQTTKPKKGNMQKKRAQLRLQLPVLAGLTSRKLLHFAGKLTFARQGRRGRAVGVNFLADVSRLGLACVTTCY